MVGTLGKGSRSARLTNSFLHVSGAVVTAAAAGFGLATLGSRVPDPVALLVAAFLCFAYGVMELGLVRLPLPETGRQVPATWRYRLPSPVAAILYGLLLGPGVGTRVATASYVALLGIVAFECAPVEGAAVLGAFGLARSMAAAVAAQPARRDPARGISWSYGFAESTRFIRFMLTFVTGSGLLAGAIFNHLGA
jgi:hypothetical protein